MFYLIVIVGMLSFFCGCFFELWGWWESKDRIVDAVTVDEISEFLTTFFKLYPTATAQELSYYVNEGILQTIEREQYQFEGLISPVYATKDNRVTVALSVRYYDNATHATQISQFNLLLDKSGRTWKIVG